MAGGVGLPTPAVRSRGVRFVVVVAAVPHPPITTTATTAAFGVRSDLDRSETCRRLWKHGPCLVLSPSQMLSPKTGRVGQIDGTTRYRVESGRWGRCAVSCKHRMDQFGKLEARNFFYSGRTRALLAEHIPGARLIEHDSGATVLNGLSVKDAEAVFDETAELLTGTRPEIKVDRVLTTVLSTDIVGSTERAVAVGDRRWNELLSRSPPSCPGRASSFQGSRDRHCGRRILCNFRRTCVGHQVRLCNPGIAVSPGPGSPCRPSHRRGRPPRTCRPHRRSGCRCRGTQRGSLSRAPSPTRWRGPRSVSLTVASTN